MLREMAAVEDMYIPPQRKKAIMQKEREARMDDPSQPLSFSMVAD